MPLRRLAIRPPAQRLRGVAAFEPYQNAMARGAMALWAIEPHSMRLGHSLYIIVLMPDGGRRPQPDVAVLIAPNKLAFRILLGTRDSDADHKASVEVAQLHYTIPASVWKTLKRRWIASARSLEISSASFALGKLRVMWPIERLVGPRVELVGGVAPTS